MTAGDERLSPADTSPSSSSASGRRSASRTSRLLAPLLSTTLMRPPAAACDKPELFHATCMLKYGQGTQDWEARHWQQCAQGFGPQNLGN